VTALRDDTALLLHRTVLDRQRTGRVPGVFAGVVRGGGLVWEEGLGAADLAHPGTPPDADHQFLVASNTKTFTAVLVMALRDEGRLSLDDTLDTSSRRFRSAG
jgi:CubicO group peptidase (beta-lactamase class C family)